MNRLFALVSLAVREAMDWAASRAGSRHPGRPDFRQELRLGTVEGLLTAAALGLSVLALPTVAHWRIFAFEDTGASLAVLDLTRQGGRPGIDNGYLYGLLPLTMSRLWYGLLGATPWAALAAWTVGNVLMAWGMARFAVHARVGLTGVGVMLAAMPLGGIQSLAHTIEPVLLIHALAEQARGRRGAALILVTVSAFVKASMAYVYGLVLLVLILGAPRAGESEPARPSNRLHALLPATVVAVALLSLLAGLYGPSTLLESLFPSRAAVVYRQEHFGFFRGSGRNFWRPPGARITYYLATPAGFWLAGSLVLLAGALEGVLHRPAADPAAGDDPGRNREVIATCAVLHLAFVYVFFGNAWSWTYYAYLLVMGLAALAPRSRFHALAVLVLTLMALLGQKARIEGELIAWRDRRPSAETLGLWVRPEEWAEWREVRRLVRGRRPVVLATTDGLAILDPEFAPPALFYLAPGQVTEVEIRRKRDRIASARFVVETPTVYATWPSETWRVFRAALDGSERVFDGRFYRVYRRARPSAPGCALEARGQAHEPGLPRVSRGIRRGEGRTARAPRIGWVRRSDRREPTAILSQGSARW